MKYKFLRMIYKGLVSRTLNLNSIWRLLNNSAYLLTSNDNNWKKILWF